MKIAILNECFLTDLHLTRLRKLGNVAQYQDTDTEQKAIERLAGIDIALIDCFLTPLNKNVFDKIPTVRYITLNSIGFDPVDIEAAKTKKIQISNIPGFSADAVAEHAIALMFATVRRIIPLDKKMRENPYEIDPSDSSQLPFLGFNLRDRTIGIVGLGKIGSRVAIMAHLIGMTVLGYSRSGTSIQNVHNVSLEELLMKSDIVTLHIPLNDTSENLIGEKELSLMKKYAVLINTARGKVIHTEALYNALKNGSIGGAGLDIIADAPKNHPIFKLSSVVFTPHAAWYTKESFESMANMLVANVEAFIKGKPINLIHA